MEDVLDVYERPDNPRRPVVCMDETSLQLLGEVRTPLAARSGRVRREDDEYERHGVCNLFLAVEPLGGWRSVAVTARRTRGDWASYMRDLAAHYADADRIVVVLDNLNTHGPASFYEAFPAAEAHALTQRFEFHHTPIHGSWLNIAEIELSVLSRQCLDRRLPNRDALAAEVATWAADRNAAPATIEWRFTTVDARIKLKRLYPAL
jgi:DDE superfamily endonuclease